MRLPRLTIIIMCSAALSLATAAQNPTDQPSQDRQPLVGSTVPTSGARHTSPAAGSANPKNPDPQNVALSQSDASYVIGPDDVLNVTVWHEPDLSAISLPVRPDGKISLPLLHDIQAADLTPMQLSQEITQSLKKYVSEPQVTIVVAAINSKRIYVLGQVARAGAYPMLPNMTVVQALSSAGGLQQYANPKKIYVLRADKKLPFNYKQAIRGEHMEQNIILKPGDSIVVP